MPIIVTLVLDTFMTLRQGSKDQKPRDQFETKRTLHWTLFHIKKTH